MTSTAPLTAIYPGTFDPMTLGHEDLMRRAARLFDRLILAVAAGHHKRTMFSPGERLEMAREIARPYPNVAACCAISWWKTAARSSFADCAR